MAKRYQPSELIGEHGGVQTFAGRDVVNGLPVRLYSFVGEPTLKEGALKSDFIPPVLSSSFYRARRRGRQRLFGRIQKVEGSGYAAPRRGAFAANRRRARRRGQAGVVHGDLSPERIFFDREGGKSGRFVLEGYGVPWPVRPSEFSAPERISGPSFAGDIFSWARTVKHLSGPLPGDLRDLLDRCLNADPGARPHAHELRLALERYPFSGGVPKPNQQAHRDTSAFERYAEDDAEDDPGAERDGLGDDLSNLTLPPKTFKLKEYRRQQTAQSPERETAEKPVPEPAQREPAPETSTPSSPLTNAPVSNAPVSNAPVSSVRSLPGTPEAQRSGDLLRQLDATEAYKVRLAAHNAKHGAKGSVQAGDVSTTKPPAPTALPITRTRVTQTVTQQPTQATEPAPPPPRVRVQPIPNAAGAARAKKDSSRKLDDPDDFEVIDDIDERAPDPTLYRGGRRVLLLTLLGIALLVLLVLQFINA